MGHKNGLKFQNEIYYWNKKWRRSWKRCDIAGFNKKIAKISKWDLLLDMLLWITRENNYWNLFFIYNEILSHIFFYSQSSNSNLVSHL